MNRFAHTLSALAICSLAFGQQADRSFREGLLSLRNEDHRTAIAHFTNAVADQPKHAKAWYYRGVSRVVIGDHTGAVHDLDRALLLDPSDANALLRRAEVYLKANRYADARRDLDQLLQQHPWGPIAEHGLFTQGQVGIAEGDYEAARNSYDRLLEMAPKDPKAWYDRGIARGHLGDHDGAIMDLTQAIALDPDLDKAYGSRAVELIHQDRTEEACTDLHKARELGDGSVDELLIIYCY
ncbi:MAG: tetratricopeptide repeat protein [Flavobacteriales bacterium]|nr:tetratricopeptide repeat protein [Flavobacteriales bacterium]MCB0784442.1 tetratricopeptide repeat protein [Flavobacteriales bacterium]MCB0787730.1 tetratricopeptide repeat protein [Flavobacteriales bacterium]MCB0807888.1 tetratricopeptide repeat protein [Flavobacteriales bacterium]MCB0816946.1 tetratricopeptide repeat protein [Flavobacteriales bacterium]